MPRKKRKITANDLYKFKLISGNRLSPDGRHVVYTVQRVDRKTEKKYSNLWIAPTARGNPRQLTYGDQSDSSPEWSPDGSQIAFLSNRGSQEKPPQIYLLPMAGGEARPLSQIEGTIGSLAWSPNGKKLLCIVRKTDQNVLEREKDAQQKKLGTVARRYGRVFYKLDGFGYLPEERWHIWTVDVRTGKASQITDHEIYDELHPAWSPDGKWIAFISNRSKDPDLNPDADDLFIIPAGGGEFRKIDTPIGGKFSPAFSPDNRWIAYFGQEGEGQWYRNTGLWIVPVDGSASPRNLTKKYDLHVSASTINDMGSPEQMPPAWTNDSRRIAFQVTVHGKTVLKSVSIDGKDLQTLIDEQGVVSSFDFDRDETRLAYFLGKMDDPGQIYVLDLKNGKSQKLTRQNQRLLNAIDLGKIEEVWIEGPAGNDFQGWILKPPGFRSSKKYPAILEIHGGPLTQYGNFFMHEFYLLAAQGYVVTFSNPRGGRGYGEKHAKAIWGGWGGADYDDLMAWTDYVSGLPYINPDRLGVTGGSYGGFMTVWIIGHTDRFKAAVTQRCVSNLVSMWGSSDFNWVFQQILGNKAPFENLQKFWKHSPMKYIGNARTPTMVIHSENDMRCPIEQGEQVFVALKRLGVDTEMIRFPGEPHGLSRVGRTDRRIERLNHIVRWFDRFLK